MVSLNVAGSPCRRPIQRAELGVHPVEVATAISRQKAVRDSDLVDSQPGVALQVQGLSQVYLEVAVRAGSSCGCPRRSLSCLF